MTGLPHTRVGGAPHFSSTKVTLPRNLCRGNVTDDYLSPLNARVRKASLTIVNATHARVSGRHLSGSGNCVFAPVENVSAALRPEA